MPEGISIETGQNPTSEVNQYTEAPFRVVQSKYRQLSARENTASSSDEKERISKEKQQLEERRFQLISSLEEVGGLDGIKRTAETLESMLLENQLTSIHILEERRYARNLSEQEDEEYKGLSEWYYNQRLDDLQKKLDIQTQEAKKIREREEQAKKDKEALEFTVLSEDKEQQVATIRAMLLIIESTDSELISTDVNFAGGESAKLAQRIMSWIGEDKIKSEELQREALARIRLQHCAAIMAAIPGDVDKATPYLLGAFSKTELKKYALRGSDFEFLLNRQNEAFTGLKIAEAWEVLQEAAVNKIDGVRYLGKGLTQSKKENLNESMVAKIASKISRENPSEHDMEIAKKSLKLAERIAVATRETSVWNTDLEGNDPLAEAIYLSKYRKERTKDKGILLTIDTIRGFGSSFFRVARGAEKEVNDKRFISDPTLELSVLVTKPERYTAWLAHNRAPEGNNYEPEITKLKTLSPDQFDYSKLSEGAYMSYLTTHVLRVLKVKEYCQKAMWKRDDLNQEAVEKMYDPFDTVDPENINKIRSQLVLGILWSFYCAKDSNLASTLGWDNLALADLTESLTRTVKKTDSGLQGFLSEESFARIVNTLKNKYNTDIYHAAAMAKITGKASDRVINITK